MTAHALVRAIARIVGGQRLRADWLEAEADTLDFRGETARADQLRASAAHHRATAAAAVRGLGRVVRELWASFEWQEQTRVIQQGSAADWVAEREQKAERRQAAEQRVAARRASAKADAAQAPPASRPRLRRSA